MAFLPNPFNIQPVIIPKLSEMVDYYDQSFEMFMTDEHIHVNWRDGSDLQLMDLEIDSDKDEQWARLFEKSFERLKEADSKIIKLEETLLENEKLAQEVKLLKSKIFGTSSEQSSPPPDSASNDDAEIDQQKPKTQKSKTQRDPETYTGRKKLSDIYEREDVIYDIPDAEKKCKCCDGKIHFFGQDVSEKVVILPERVSVRRRIRYKFICHKCDEFHYADMPKTMLSGSNYDSAEFLANIAIKRYVQCMPFYRIEEDFNSKGYPISRSVMSTNFCKVADRLYPLTEALRAQLITNNVIHADETTFQVLKEKDRAPQTKSYMWLFQSGRHEKNQIVFFDYQETRSGQHPKNFLRTDSHTFDGFLCVDGYAGYNSITSATRVGCMSHVRRKFNDALKALENNCSDSNAQKAINMIDQLYLIEKNIKDEPPDIILKIRNDKSIPLLYALKEWVDEMKLSAVPSMLFGKAIKYALSQWTYVSRYVENGELPIDNNAAERSIKKFVMGRKNWLFADSVGGAYANATMYTLVATAMANGLDPYKYLLEVFEKFPNMKRSDDISMLFPWNIANSKPELKKAA